MDNQMLLDVFLQDDFSFKLIAQKHILSDWMISFAVQPTVGRKPQRQPAAAAEKDTYLGFLNRRQAYWQVFKEQSSSTSLSSLELDCANPILIKFHGPEDPEGLQSMGVSKESDTTEQLNRVLRLS